MTNNQTKGLLLATTTSFLWGFLAVALKIALNHFDSYTIVWFRFALAFVVLLAYYGFKKPEYLKVFRKPPFLLILAAVLLGANYIGFMQGVYYAGPGATQVIIQTGPITLGIIGFIFFKEKVTANSFRSQLVAIVSVSPNGLCGSFIGLGWSHLSGW